MQLRTIDYIRQLLVRKHLLVEQDTIGCTLQRLLAEKFLDVVTWLSCGVFAFVVFAEDFEGFGSAILGKGGSLQLFVHIHELEGSKLKDALRMGLWSF